MFWIVAPVPPRSDREVRNARPEESAHRGTLASDARWLSPRPRRRVLQSRRLRRVPGRGLRRVPAAAARARARADGVPRAGGSTGAMHEARAALATFVGARADDLVFCPERDVCAQRGDPLAADPARGGDPHDEARVRRDRADARVHPRQRRARRAGRARRQHRHPDSRDRRLAHHVADGARPSGRGDLRGRPEGGCPLDRGRRARAGPPSARRRVARRGRLCGQLPQVAVRAEGLGVPLGAARAPGLDRAARHQLGLPRRRRLRRAARLAGDARPCRVSRRPEGNRGARDVRPRARAGPGGRGRAQARAAGAAAAAWRAIAPHACAHGALAGSTRRSGDGYTTSIGSRCRSTSGRTRRFCASRSARTTTRPTSNAWPTRSDRLSLGDPVRDPDAARRPRPPARRGARGHGRDHGRRGDACADRRLPRRAAGEGRDGRRDRGVRRGDACARPRGAPGARGRRRRRRHGRRRRTHVQHLDDRGDRRCRRRRRRREAREPCGQLGLGFRGRAGGAGVHARAVAGADRGVDRHARLRLHVRAAPPSGDAPRGARSPRARDAHDLQRARPPDEPGRCARPESSASMRRSVARTRCRRPGRPRLAACVRRARGARHRRALAGGAEPRLRGRRRRRPRAQRRPARARDRALRPRGPGRRLAGRRTRGLRTRSSRGATARSATPSC